MGAHGIPIYQIMYILLTDRYFPRSGNVHESPVIPMIYICLYSLKICVCVYMYMHKD